MNKHAKCRDDFREKKMGTVDLKGCVYPFHVRRGKSHLLSDSKDRQRAWILSESQSDCQNLCFDPPDAGRWCISVLPAFWLGQCARFTKYRGVSGQTAARDESRDSPCARLNC